MSTSSFVSGQIKYDILISAASQLIYRHCQRSKAIESFSR